MRMMPVCDAIIARLMAGLMALAILFAAFAAPAVAVTVAVAVAVAVAAVAPAATCSPVPTICPATVCPAVPSDCTRMFEIPSTPTSTSTSTSIAPTKLFPNQTLANLTLVMPTSGSAFSLTGTDTYNPCRSDLFRAADLSASIDASESSALSAASRGDASWAWLSGLVSTVDSATAWLALASANANTNVTSVPPVTAKNGTYANQTISAMAAAAMCGARTTRLPVDDLSLLASAPSALADNEVLSLAQSKHDLYKYGFVGMTLMSSPQTLDTVVALHKGAFVGSDMTFPSETVTAAMTHRQRVHDLEQQAIVHQQESLAKEQQLLAKNQELSAKDQRIYELEQQLKLALTKPARSYVESEPAPAAAHAAAGMTKDSSSVPLPPLAQPGAVPDHQHSARVLVNMAKALIEPTPAPHRHHHHHQVLNTEQDHDQYPLSDTRASWTETPLTRAVTLIADSLDSVVHAAATRASYLYSFDPAVPTSVIPSETHNLDVIILDVFASPAFITIAILLLAVVPVAKRASLINLSMDLTMYLPRATGMFKGLTATSAATTMLSGPAKRRLRVTAIQQSAFMQLQHHFRVPQDLLHVGSTSQHIRRLQSALSVNASRTDSAVELDIEEITPKAGQEVKWTRVLLLNRGIINIKIDGHMAGQVMTITTFFPWIGSRYPALAGAMLDFERLAVKAARAPTSSRPATKHHRLSYPVRFNTVYLPAAPKISDTQLIHAMVACFASMLVQRQQQQRQRQRYVAAAIILACAAGFQVDREAAQVLADRTRRCVLAPDVPSFTGLEPKLRAEITGDVGLQPEARIPQAKGYDMLKGKAHIAYLRARLAAINARRLAAGNQPHSEQGMAKVKHIEPTDLFNCVAKHDAVKGKTSTASSLRARLAAIGASRLGAVKERRAELVTGKAAAEVKPIGLTDLFNWLQMILPPLPDWDECICFQAEDHCRCGAYDMCDLDAEGVLVPADNVWYVPSHRESPPMVWSSASPLYTACPIIKHETFPVFFHDVVPEHFQITLFIISDRDDWD
ncbi:hypothetical protein H9P43_006025 [Blastocladiella emersonii ATCC 22665]|nr:hypothetical protein H9P43_006025 [Blastocladiella emersonii ATCC 22665]